MKENNVVKEKSLAFAIRIVKMVKFLTKTTPIAEQPILTQVLKSGTSIGANIREAEQAESPDIFIHRYKVALKEVNETAFWLEVLYNTEYIVEEQYSSIMNDCNELNDLLIAIVRNKK